MPNSPILHVESDVLLLPNFPWKLFEKLEKICWQKFNEQEDVASLIYSPNLVSTVVFFENLMELFMRDSSLTDMTSLSKLRRMYPNTYGEIPSWPIEFTSNIESQRDSGISSLTLLSEFSNFGYFDSAAIGMWFLGQDPRNRHGFARKFIENPNSAYDPGKLKLSVANNFEVTDQYQKYIYSFHVHSKSRKILGQSNHKLLKKSLLNDRMKDRFDFYCFLLMWQDYIRRGKDY
jgi:hypothetical protein